MGGISEDITTFRAAYKRQIHTVITTIRFMHISYGDRSLSGKADFADTLEIHATLKGQIYFRYIVDIVTLQPRRNAVDLKTLIELFETSPVLNAYLFSTRHR
jgi:hypothetical protein